MHAAERSPQPPPFLLSTSHYVCGATTASGPGEDIIQPLDMSTTSLLWHLMNHRVKFRASQALTGLSGSPSGCCPQLCPHCLSHPAAFSCPLEPLSILSCSMRSHASVLLPLLGIAFPSFSGQQAPICLSKPSTVSSPSETVCSLPFAPFPLVLHPHRASSAPQHLPPGTALMCCVVLRNGCLPECKEQELWNQTVIDPNSGLITSWPRDLKQMCNFSKSRVPQTCHENNRTETAIMIPA